MDSRSSICLWASLCLVLNFYVALVSSDIRPIVELQNKPQHKTERVNLDAYQYDRYLNFEEMERRLQSISAIYYNKLDLKVVGKSVEGRNIYLVTITDNVIRSEAEAIDEQKEKTPNSVRMQRRMPFNILEERDSVVVKNQNITLLIPESKIESSLTRIAVSHKPVIFVDAGIHAREWVAPAAAFYLIDQLLKPSALTSALEWRIMPQVNPDGYLFSQTSDRFWRKNRAFTSDSNCVGVDLNRNFGVHFEETESNPCSEVYGGPHAFSEPETQAVRNEVEAVKNRLQAYITIHTYGQMFLYPYGYTNRKSPVAAQKLKNMGDGMAQVIHNLYKSEYTVGQASMIGAAAGGSDDWAYIYAKAPYSYTFELQPKVHHLKFRQEGFDLSATRLRQAVDECWLALNYLGTKILEEKNQIKRGAEKNKEQQPTPKETKSDSFQERKIAPNLPELMWTDLVQKLMVARSKPGKNTNNQANKDCVVINSTYVCPHMVFWNSMHT